MRASIFAFASCAVPLCVALGGCANPLNRETSDRYAETCSAAEDGGRLDVAEQACYRALVNVDAGNLGPVLKSQRLYNLARVKRRLAKFVEAEDLLRQSLAIEEPLTGPTSPQTGRRLVELAANLAGEDRWRDGAPYLLRAAPIYDRFAPGEKDYTREMFRAYGEALRRQGETALADRLDAAGAAL